MTTATPVLTNAQPNADALRIQRFLAVHGQTLIAELDGTDHSGELIRWALTWKREWTKWNEGK
jgi:hypothetical protein